MNITREWVTPVTIGAFLISAVTGVAMFFHIDTGLAKVAHEWLSWLLLAAVVLHAIVNFSAIKCHLSKARGQLIAGVCVLALAASFMPLGGGGEPPFMAPARALADAPLSVLAQVAKITPAELRERLAKAHLPAPASDQQTLSELAGPDRHRQMHVLRRILEK